MFLLNFIGILASFFTVVSLLPQLIKIIKEKKAEDISLLMLFTLFTGVALWVCYGFIKKDAIIIVSNSISLCINVAIVVFALKYKKDKT